MWSRDRNLDSRSGAWFQPNHFILQMEYPDSQPTQEKTAVEHHTIIQDKITSLFGHKQSTTRTLYEFNGRHALSVSEGIRSHISLETTTTTASNLEALNNY